MLCTLQCTFLVALVVSTTGILNDNSKTMEGHFISKQVYFPNGVDRSRVIGLMDPDNVGVQAGIVQTPDGELVSGVDFGDATGGPSITASSAPIVIDLGVSLAEPIIYQ